MNCNLHQSPRQESKQNKKNQNNTKEIIIHQQKKMNEYNENIESSDEPSLLNFRNY